MKGERGSDCRVRSVVSEKRGEVTSNRLQSAAAIADSGNAEERRRTGRAGSASNPSFARI